MKIALVVSHKAVVVDVTITNAWSEKLYIANYNFDYYGLLGEFKHDYSRNHNALPTRSLAYASIDGETLTLLQGNGPPPPPDIQVIAPRLALYSRLLPAETVTERIQVPLPICEWDAYNDPEVDGAIEVDVSRVSLSVEYLRESMTQSITPHPSFRDVFDISGYPRGKLTASADLPKAVKGHKRPKAPKRVPVY